MRKWLNEEQKGRLIEVVNEALVSSSWDDLAQRLSCSIGSISGIRSGKIKGVSEHFALGICKGLGINPYYVSDGLSPKYREWKVAFSADNPKQSRYSS